MDVNSTSPNVDTPALFTTAHRPESWTETGCKMCDLTHYLLSELVQYSYSPLSESSRLSLMYSTASFTCSSLQTSSWTTFMRSEWNSSSSFAPSPSLSYKDDKSFRLHQLITFTRFKSRYIYLFVFSPSLRSEVRYITEATLFIRIYHIFVLDCLCA